MPNLEPHVCQCADCQQTEDHLCKEQHRQMNFFLAQLNLKQRRWYAALESNRIGRDGDQAVSLITGISIPTIRQARREIALLLENPSSSTKMTFGRPLAEIKQPTLEKEIEKLISNEVAGDPMSEQKWVRASLRQISRQLKERGLKACPSTVQRILRKMRFSLRANSKKRNGIRANYPERDDQFKYIASKRQEFTDKGLPIISVDTKKKELIGDFRRSGKTWCRDAEEVNEHDFSSLAKCRAVPYGIYDVTKNRGCVFVGTSNDTPEFAVNAIVQWWKDEGKILYGEANQLLILADSGGSNGFRSRAWKYHLQIALSDAFDLEVSVCHYPTGCSKWNPVEHRLFSYISINWQGKPLRTLDTMLGYIRGTSTTTGLTVKAYLLDGYYQKKQKILAGEFKQLKITYQETCPKWNYNIYPRYNIDDTT